MKKYLLFDLDGTLTNTGEGIMKSAQYALDAFGIHGEPEEKLRRFVGPPLHESFMGFYGLSPEEAVRAVEKYRERYREKGVFESPLYEGIDALLQSLRDAGAVLCVATSKPQVFAEQILNLRGVRDFFTVVVGANLDGTRTDKAEVITEVLRQLGASPEEALMIGDRRQDIAGARACGVESVGVEYGFAEENELQNAGADYVVPSVAALEELCKGLNAGRP